MTENLFPYPWESTDHLDKMRKGAGAGAGTLPNDDFVIPDPERQWIPLHFDRLAHRHRLASVHQNSPDILISAGSGLFSFLAPSLPNHPGRISFVEVLLMHSQADHACHCVNQDAGYLIWFMVGQRVNTLFQNLLIIPFIKAGSRQPIQCPVLPSCLCARAPFPVHEGLCETRQFSVIGQDVISESRESKINGFFSKLMM